MAKKKKGTVKKTKGEAALKSKTTSRKKNVLITGVTGTVGSRLAEAQSNGGRNASFSSMSELPADSPFAARRPRNSRGVRP